MTTNTCTACDLPLNDQTWNGACEGHQRPAALCIAHGTLTTGYPGKPREWASCGWCIQQLDRQYAADPSIPRNKAGAVLGAKSKARAAHRDAFKDRLTRHIARAVIRGQHAMTEGEYADAFPFSYAGLFNDDRLVAYLHAA